MHRSFHSHYRSVTEQQGSRLDGLRKNELVRGVCPRWWMPSHLSIIYHQL
nr:MAG TPA: Protein of unknown function (DUF3039) [Caudoviricetes sp.]